MSSSCDPAKGEGLGRRAAARLHADRFGHALLPSLLTLAAADRVITHPDGGVLAITHLGRPWPRVIATAGAYVALIALVAIAVANRQYTLAGAASVGLAGVILIPSPKAVRKLRHTRRHRVIDEHAWLITDVATQPHRGIGDELMRCVTHEADAAGLRLVLSTRADNMPAIALYLRHGFTSQQVRSTSVLFDRRPVTLGASADSVSRSSKAIAGRPRRRPGSRRPK